MLSCGFGYWFSNPNTAGSCWYSHQAAELLTEVILASDGRKESSLNDVFKWLQTILYVGDGSQYKIPLVHDSMSKSCICSMRLALSNLAQGIDFFYPACDFGINIFLYE